MAENNITVQVEADAEKAKSTLSVINIDLTKLENTLKGVEDVLNKMYLELGKMEKNGVKANNSLKNTANQVNKVGNNANKASKYTSKFMSSLLTGISLTAITTAFSKIGSLITSVSASSVDASEQLNLFNRVFGNITENGETAFSTLGAKAYKFQNQLHEAFNTNMVETMKMQAMYQSLGSNIGIGDKYAEIMSEAMTKMTYDLASMYNKSESDVMTAIQSGVYAGQTRPMRAYGVDLTQSNLDVTLDTLGITDKSVSDLSQAEKEILRYITVLKQADIAMGDFADTINSPANQIKMLKQQFEELRIAIGNMFVNAFAKIAPYVNAIVMVAKELLKTLASLFGISLEDYGTGSSQDYLDYLEGIEDGADGASNAVKELKRQTLGFDQINNLTTPTSSKKGSGSGSAIGAIDQRLLDAIADYDNGMEKVKNKAGQIRDKIMEWLGFTKEINTETGEVNFKYDTTNGKFAPLISSVKEFYKIIKKIVSFQFKNIENLYNNFFKPLATWTFDKGIPSLLNSISGFFEKIDFERITSQVSNSAKTVWSALKPVLDVLSDIAEVAGPVIGWFVDNAIFVKLATMQITWEVLSIKIGLVKTALDGLWETINVLADFDFLGLASGFDKIMGDIGDTWYNLKEWFSDFLNLFNGEGSISIGDFYIDFDKLTPSENQISRLQEWKNKIDDNVYALTSETNTCFDLANQLYDVLDSEGKVKEGQEDRAKVILNQLNKALGTEYELDGNLIKINGEVVTSYQSIKDEINKTMVARMKLANLNVLEEEYKKALDRQLELKEALTHAEDKLNNATIRNDKEAIKYWTEEVERRKKSIEWNDNQIKAWNRYQSVIELGLDETSQEYKEAYADMSKYFGEHFDYLMEKTDEFVKVNEVKASETAEAWNKDEITLQISADTTFAKKEIAKVQGVKIQAELEIDKAVIVQTAVNNIKTKISNVLSNLGLTKKADGGLFSNGSWKPITQYASGGLPSTGQMFIAREAGPELVGKIGNSTAVMNNNQIVNSVASGVAQAVSSVIGSGSDTVEVYVHTDEGTVIDRINRKKRQTGVCPIEF